MTDADEDLAPPAPRSRYRWLRRLVMWPALVAGVVVLILLTGRWQVGRVGQRELTVTLNRLDVEDPDWRLDAIMNERARRAVPPPAENANTRILALAEEMPKNWNDMQTEVSKTDWLRSCTDNHRPGTKALAEAEKMAEPTRATRRQALEIRNLRPGLYPLVVANDPIATLLPHIDRARRVLSLIEYDAYWEVLHGDADRGIADARAALAVARSIGDEPFLISQLVRIASAKVSANIAIQTLAWSEPTEGLAELQAELLAEADVPWLWQGLRGERASLNRIFEGLENGSIPWENLFKYADHGNPGPQHYAAFQAYKALLPGDRAKCMQLCTELLAAAKLPHHEQLVAIRATIKKVPTEPPETFRYIGTRLLLPACERFAEASLRVRADLLCAATTVACERFRRKHGGFPKELAELVPEFLPAVPANPFDAQPLTYRVYPDRVTVSCVCVGMSQMLPNPPDEFRTEHGKPAITGSRLWAVEQRGLPPEEKPEEKLDP